MKIVTVLIIVFLFSAIECRYKPYYPIPGRTARLTCLEHVPFLDRLTDQVYYEWIYNKRPLNLTEHPDKWLDDNNRTLVLDDVSKKSEGRYVCRCMWLRSRKRCRAGRKLSQVVQKTIIRIPKLELVGCFWTENRMNIIENVPWLKQKYSFICTCETGPEAVCGHDVKMQRLDRESRRWIDVEFGYRPGALSLVLNRQRMEISAAGSNLTYEESGRYRCVSYDEEGILCETQQAKEIEADFPAVPLREPIFIEDKRYLQYGLPLVVVTLFILSILIGRILRYHFTSRIVVESSKSTRLIGKWDPVDGVLSRPSAPSSSSIYPALETIETISTNA